jgi:NADH-quinone oxidoreductase subunit G
MTKIVVDGREVDVPADYTLLQACEAAGAEIPRFCFHERLSIAGNCRMCLVELKGAPKPVASCAWGVRDCRPGPNGEAPEVSTKSAVVKKARHGIMEFLLINHPLDCPICDQGGECDLQDQAMAFGVAGSRFHENKRAVEDKYIGPIVRTSMNRCIHCTRCVRFTSEVAGTGDMGAIGRGEDMEITTYLESSMGSELQGNVADLCPVGALLQKPLAFKARPWEMNKTQVIDVMDALGANIRVDSRGREVLRILPRINDDVNEEWISDKTRHVVDGLKAQRLDRPYIRDNGRLRAATWAEAFATIAARVKNADPRRVGFIAGDLVSAEDMFAFKALADGLGSPNLDCRQDGSQLHPRYGRGSYLFNATVPGIESATSLLVIGANPRRESPVLNARIRKRFLKGGFPVQVIGERADLTYAYEYLGAGPDTLRDLAGKVEKAGERPMVIVGQGAVSRRDGAAVLSLAAKVAQGLGALADGWNGFSVLHTAASRVAGLDLGLVPGEGGLDALAMAEPGALDVLFLFGADEIAVGPGAFVVYQGSHGDHGAHRADVILPGAAYTEKAGLYANTEGRVQQSDRAVFPPGEAREDWAILRALSDQLGVRLPFDSYRALKAALQSSVPHMARVEHVAPAEGDVLNALTGIAGDVERSPFRSPVADFYLTNPIARCSAVMAECSVLLAQGHLQQAAE